MLLIYIIILLLNMATIAAVYGSRIFIKAQSSGWYPLFLQSVIDAITTDYQEKILDIGTGPGKLPELLIQKDSSLQITGIDINASYIDEAKQRVKHPNVSFKHVNAGAQLDFAKKEFDVVTFCSVLFLLDDYAKTILMNEAVRVLKPTGKIIVLSPSGKKSIFSSIHEINGFPKSRYNWTYFIWKTATKNRGEKWQKSYWLKDFSNTIKMKYLRTSAFNNNASIEILTNTIQ